MIKISKDDIDRTIIKSKMKEYNVNFIELKKRYIDGKDNICSYLKSDGNGNYGSFSCSGQGCGSCRDEMLNNHNDIINFMFKKSNMEGLE